MPAEASPEARGFWTSAIALLLIVWEPVGLAMVAAGALPRLAAYGAPAYLLLVWRALASGVGIAAGLALWARRQHGPRLGQIWVALSAIGVVATFATPYFPNNRLPGRTAPLLIAILGYHAVLFTCLTVVRVRASSASR